MILLVWFNRIKEASPLGSTDICQSFVSREFPVNELARSISHYDKTIVTFHLSCTKIGR